jgi:2-polyprenyl-6-methoxyphenol hydroxylase-like FAD-dependent oxidoreductase
MTESSPSILIAGGGIAGLATWRALKRRGIPSIVVERSVRAHDGGLAINLPGNAIAALDRLGLASAIEQFGLPVRKREYRTSGDRLLAAIDEDAFWGNDMRPRAMRRSDLIALLSSGLSPSNMVFGQPIAGVDQTDSLVRIAMDDGQELSGQLLVGADGVRSTVRRAVTGASGAVAARLASESWRFMAPNPGVDGWTLWTGRQGLVLLLPVDDTTVYGWVSLSKPADGVSHADRLQRAFRRFPDRVRRTVGWAIDHPESIYHSPVEEVRTTRWSNGRIVLIGDAAHATAPVWAEGAALAMEDALALAQFASETDDVSSVIRQFENVRQPRAAHVQAMTDKLSKAARLPHALRTMLMPFITPLSYARTYEPLKGH